MVFFANVSDAGKLYEQYPKGRVRLEHFIREDDAYGASPLPNREEKSDCLAVYGNADSTDFLRTGGLARQAMYM